ncbi:hypothetical protein [Streptomyces sp. NPDC001642]|uniref:hypothetical protein n=1 Tax=Streptomyces sp. NPDC001642 TaxID=3154392 RepID=UPI00332186FB
MGGSSADGRTDLLIASVSRAANTRVPKKRARSSVCLESRMAFQDGRTASSTHWLLGSLRAGTSRPGPPDGRLSGQLFSQLTGTRRGYEALETAGLDVRSDTLFKWLSDPEHNVRRGYRDLIHTAYENIAIVPADPIPDHITRGQYEISGVVRTGNDERTRGTRDAAPLRIDGMRGNWEEIEELWLAGGLTDDEFEDHFVDEVIVEDIGEGTDGWEFPGASYTVEVR